MNEIKTSDNLRYWLNQQGQYKRQFATAIAVRTSIRVLPFVFWGELDPKSTIPLAIGTFRCSILAWAAASLSSDDMQVANANALESDDFRNAVNEGQYLVSESVYSAAYVVSRANLSIAERHKNSEFHVVDAVYRATDEDFAAFASPEARASFRVALEADCAWLSAQMKAAQRITTRKLWPLDELPAWRNQWKQTKNQLLDYDDEGSYQVWTDWYERRIRGERAAFDIPGDRYRKEDKAILRRLADATDEDFWDKGHQYVNAELTRWLEEARARVAPPILAEISGAVAISGSATASFGPLPPIETPPQKKSAPAYGVNAQGKIDRLPHSDQTQLRDEPDQRRAYGDVRDAALELRDEGQRLGPRLLPRLERFIDSIPERFDDAEAWPLWRDGNALRRLYRAHMAVANNPEPDTAKLDPAVAEVLAGLLDIYNNFAFADDGLRAKDEQRIAPQEQASAEKEALASVALFDAVLASPDIITDTARRDILADAADNELPTDDPYSAQVLDQSNQAKKNFIAGLLSWAAKTLANPKQVGKAIAIGGMTGAAGVLGKIAMTSIIGAEYAPLMEFLATNAVAFQNYVPIAFSSYPRLPYLIEHIRLLWLNSGRK